MRVRRHTPPYDGSRATSVRSRRPQHPAGSFGPRRRVMEQSESDGDATEEQSVSPDAPTTPVPLAPAATEATREIPVPPPTPTQPVPTVPPAANAPFLPSGWQEQADLHGSAAAAPGSLAPTPVSVDGGTPEGFQATPRASATPVVPVWGPISPPAASDS